MDVHSIVEVTEAEMAILGVTHEDIPTLLLGMGIMLFVFGSVLLWKYKKNCSGISCSDVKKHIELLVVVGEKTEKILNTLTEHAKEEEDRSREDMRELRHTIDSLNADVARLSGVLIGSQALHKTRKVIKYDND